MPKQVLKIDKFEGGKNTHLHKKDIPDNAFQEAENVMFDVVGRVRPGGFAKDLLSMGDASINSVAMMADEGYGLFSFSHDYTNPNTSTEISKASKVEVSGKVGYFSQANEGSLGYAAHDGGTSVGGYIELTDASDSSAATWKLWNDVPSNNTNTGETNGGWRYDSSNRLIYCSSSSTSNNNYAVTAIGKAGRAYFVSIIGDGETSLGNASADTDWGAGQAYIFAHKGVSLTNGGETTELDDSSHDMRNAFVDIFVLGENTNGNIGIYADSSFAGRILKINVYEVPSPKDISYILAQNQRYINLLDTSLTTWRESLLPIHTSDLDSVKSGYYIADGNLRVFNADFGTICENKWYGLVNRQNFLDSTITTVDGSVAADSSTSGAYIRQWVEEDQQIYAPSANAHNESAGYTGDGNPGKAVLNDEGTGAFLNGITAADGGIEVHIGYSAITDATYDSSYHYYLSYLYDDSEQESSLFTLNSTADTGAAGQALYVAITIDYNADNNGYAFNKRVTGARLYYSDTSDSEGFKYHLLDIDFIEGCRKFDDVDFTAWQVHTAGSVVQCPSDSCKASANDPGSNPTNFFEFRQMPKVTTYEMINGYAPDEDIYFRYKAAVVASDKLWVGNIGEVDSNGGVIKRFSDRIIVSPRGRFDLLPRENFLEVAINDGDEIIKLESFSDRLLVFKRKILYIINIGKDGSEFIESENKFIGVSHPSSVIKTEGGVAWANNRGCFVYDGRNLVNLMENKISSQEWRDYTGVNPFIGFIPHRKQLLILADSYIDSFYVYDFQTKSWSINSGGVGASSNIINVEDSTETFNANPVFSTKADLATTERVGVHQVSTPGVPVTGFDLDASVDPDAVAVTAGSPGVNAQGTIIVLVDGLTLYNTVGGANPIRFYLTNGSGTLAIDSSTGAPTTGTAITNEISGVAINSMAGYPTAPDLHGMVHQPNELAEHISGAITAYQATGLYTGVSYLSYATAVKTAVGSADNGKEIRWAHKGSGSWVVQAGATSSFICTSIGNGANAVAFSSQVYIEGVNGATENLFQFFVRQYDIDSWNAGSPSYASSGIAIVKHTGGATTSASAGADSTNALLAKDLRTVASENAKIRDDFGITVSDTALAKVSTTIQTDTNDENIYFFSLTSSVPFTIFGTQVYLYETMRVFTNDNISEVGGYKLVTKDFDFGFPSVNKKIYKVYISFRCQDSFSNYNDSYVKVFYGTNGGDLLHYARGTEFSTSTSKFYGANGLTAFGSTGDLSTTLNGALDDSETGIDVTSSSSITIGDAIKVDSEVMLVTGISGNTLTCVRGYITTTTASHSDGATVLIAKPSRDTTAELKPSSSINNVKSFQLKLQDAGPVPAKFEINDITIVYRMKNIK